MACNTPCCFIHHPIFIQELSEFIEKHCGTSASQEETINGLEKLLITHFYKRIISFTEKHLGTAQGFNGFSIYWLHMAIPNSGLSRTQMPKMYLYKQDGHISFLCLDSHIQNYKDSKLREVANKRLEEMIEVLKVNH